MCFDPPAPDPGPARCGLPLSSQPLTQNSSGNGLVGPGGGRRGGGEIKKTKSKSTSHPAVHPSPYPVAAEKGEEHWKSTYNNNETENKTEEGISFDFDFILVILKARS